MDRELRVACLAMTMLAVAPAKAAAPEVVASIAPLHSLTAAVMKGVGEPVLLVPATGSDHDYALKPSDLRKLAAADLVVWVGEPLESYLIKSLQTENVPNLELIEAAGVDPRPYEEGEEHAHSEQHAHSEGHEHGHEAESSEHTHSHDHLGIDPHVWLDPVRAQAMVEAIAEKLAALDPQNAESYRRNAAAAVRHLETLDGEVRNRLAPVAGKPFITFHDGYSYLVERYGLNQVGRLTVDPDRSAGAATVSALRRLVVDQRVGCAFAEPQYDPGALQALAGEISMRIGVLDALGADLAPGPALYASLIRRNAEAIENCLLPNS